LKTKKKVIHGLRPSFPAGPRATREVHLPETCANALAPLSLTLLVALVGADDVDDAPAAHDLAVLADLLD
jgi:hypothetical protein